MTSRLDLILSFVDELDSRSDRLLQNVDQSYRIIDNIATINDEIMQTEETMDDVRALLDDNKARMNDFNSLYEQCFYLESNLHVNDAITNQVAFETLTNEFRMLVKLLEKNDQYSQHVLVPRYTDIEQDSLEETDIIGENNFHNPFMDDRIPEEQDDRIHEEAPKKQTSSLSKYISLSNLKLKPIKCTESRKVYKKKSRYRLSGIYNINPIAYPDEEEYVEGDSMCSIRTDDQSEAGTEKVDEESDNTDILESQKLQAELEQLGPKEAHQKSIKPPHSNHIQWSDNIQNIRESNQESTQVSSDQNSTQKDQIWNSDQIHWDSQDPRKSDHMHKDHQSGQPESSSTPMRSDETKSIGSRTTPDYRMHEDTISQNTSFSMGDDHQIDHKLDVNTVSTSPPEFRARSNSLPETPCSMYCKPPGKFDQLPRLSEGLEQLRSRRLDHFISCANIRHYDRQMKPEPTDGNTIDLGDQTDFDNMSFVSDFSYYSPEDNAIDDKDLACEPLDLDGVDNYEAFLRSRRLIIALDTQPQLKRSSSHDSIFKNSTVTRYTSHKFHNPASRIHLSTTPAYATVEQIHSETSPQKPRKSMASTGDVDMGISYPHATSHLDTPSKFASTQLLNEVIQRNATPKSTDDTKSTFSLFMMTSPRKSAASPGKSGISPRKSAIPDRRGSIDHISKSLTDTFLGLLNPKSSTVSPAPKMEQSTPPIAVTSEPMQKRMPVRIPRKDGYHSNLIIGPNSTRIVKHGESSVFRKPLITRVSHNSLQDAMSSSIN